MDRVRGWWGFIVAFGVLLAAMAAADVEAIEPPPPFHVYPGEFSHSGSTGGAPCDGIFSTTKYDARFQIMGPTGRTAVISFRTPPRAGFFHNLTLVGLLGPDNDVRVTKSYGDDRYLYDVVADGLVNPYTLWLKVSVQVSRKDRPREPFCSATADYSAF